MAAGNLENLEGQKFGKLTVLHAAGKNKHKQRLWNCLCECGGFTKTITGHLKNGHTKSCGCVRGEKLSNGEASFNQLFISYKRHAEEREHVFCLTKKKFRELTSSDCYYCGSPPSQIWGKFVKYRHGHYIHNGIDRLNNKRGYTIKNCVPCCGTCNWMKNRMAEKEFFTQIAKIYINKIRGKA